MYRKHYVLLLFVLFLLVLISLGNNVNASSNGVNIFRLYNPNTGEHFYTSNAAERDKLTPLGWIYEGIGWVAPTTGQPVYRLYNPNAQGGDHYYTLSNYEKNELMKKGWKYDGSFFKSGGDIKVYVAYNPNAKSGTHNYTTSRGEQNSLLSAGWKYDAVAWNGVGLGSPNLISLWAGNYHAGNTTWNTNIKINSNGTFVMQQTAGIDNQLISSGQETPENAGMITKGTVQISTTPFSGVKYSYQIPNDGMGAPSFGDGSTTPVKPVVYIKFKNASVTKHTFDNEFGVNPIITGTKTVENQDISYFFGIDGNYNYSYSYVAYGNSTNGKSLVSVDTQDNSGWTMVYTNINEN